VTYPPILFTTSTRDDRVHPAHARKMVGKMLDMGIPGVAYYENIEGGHGGAADNTQRAFMSTLAWSFLWKLFGPPPRRPGVAARLKALLGPAGSSPMLEMSLLTGAAVLVGVAVMRGLKK